MCKLGAANGIGRLLVLLLSKYCRNIIGVDKDMKGLEETASCVQKESNVSLVCYECDLRFVNLHAFNVLVTAMLFIVVQRRFVTIMDV